MTMKIILSGFGGQGVLSAGLLLAEAAMEEGWHSTFFPSYGAEMRGGTANCHVIISDTNIASPVVTEADVLIALNKPSFDKFLPAVKEGGTIIVNSSIIKEKLDELKRRYLAWEASLPPIPDDAMLGNAGRSVQGTLQQVQGGSGRLERRRGLTSA